MAPELWPCKPREHRQFLREPLDLDQLFFGGNMGLIFYQRPRKYLSLL